MPVPPLPGPFWLIGCGNMAGAMLDGWIAAGIDRSRISVVRPSGKPVAAGVRLLSRLPEDEVPAIVMLGVKPYQLDDVAATLAPVLGPHTILVSILAGVETASLHDRFPVPATIVRAMPNTPVRLNKGAIGLYTDSGDPAARAMVADLMAALGLVEWVADEALFDLVTALSGSGPAFLFRFIEALGEAGASLGLDEGQARRLALATVEGAAALAAASEESPAALADRVASPGGSTRKGLDILDGEGGLATLLRDTLAAAVARNREMATAAHRPIG